MLTRDITPIKFKKGSVSKDFVSYKQQSDSTFMKCEWRVSYDLSNIIGYSVHRNQIIMKVENLPVEEKGFLSTKVVYETKKVFSGFKTLYSYIIKRSEGTLTQIVTDVSPDNLEDSKGDLFNAEMCLEVERDSDELLPLVETLYKKLKVVACYPKETKS